jgi:glucose-1-phosphate thymidylyltransferase
MKVIIPMAGHGKRLRPHTYSRPKPLLNVAGQPILKHLLDSLAGLEIEEYIFVVGHLGEQIEEYIAKNYAVKATFVVQEELIGQAHAIYLAREHLGGPVIVLFSDTLFEADLSVITTTDADAIAFVKEVEDPRRFGVVEIDDEGRVTRFIEKPDSLDNKQAVVGLYYLRDSEHMLRAIETQMEQNQMTKGEFYLADTFQIMVDEGAIFRIQEVDVWLDCGKPETMLETNRFLLERKFDNSSEFTSESVAIIPPVYIDPSARVENAVIGPYAVISAGCHIRDSIIRDSIIDTGAEVVRSLLDRSLIGCNVRVSGQYGNMNIGDDTSVSFS